MSTEIKQDVTPKEAGVSEVPSEMVMASAKQTETQVTTTLGEAHGELEFCLSIDCT